MAVISITISESEAQIVAGIPKIVVITTNLPATVFFTLDGTDPTTSSSVVTGPINLPSIGDVTLKLFATDGINNSIIVAQTYTVTSGATNRTPRDKISGIESFTTGAQYPFGSNFVEGLGIYGNIGGTTVDDPTVAGILDGYDGFGNRSHETDLPLADYDFIFSEADSIGQRGAGIGTLPAEVTIIIPKTINPVSIADGSPDANSPVFNPRSLVIFQDASKDPYDPEVPQLNRGSFSTENNETARYGRNFTLGAEGNLNRGTILRQQFNPRDNTITFYYWDADTGRWIISKVPYMANDKNLFNYSSMVYGRERSVGKVFKWLPFRYRSLF